MSFTLKSTAACLAPAFTSAQNGSPAWPWVTIATVIGGPFLAEFTGVGPDVRWPQATTTTAASVSIGTSNGRRIEPLIDGSLPRFSPLPPRGMPVAITYQRQTDVNAVGAGADKRRIL